VKQLPPEEELLRLWTRMPPDVQQALLVLLNWVLRHTAGARPKAIRPRDYRIFLDKLNEQNKTLDGVAAEWRARKSPTARRYAEELDTHLYPGELKFSEGLVKAWEREAERDKYLKQRAREILQEEARRRRLSIREAERKRKHWREHAPKTRVALCATCQQEQTFVKVRSKNIGAYKCEKCQTWIFDYFDNWSKER
jgi:hypothetical protein